MELIVNVSENWGIGNGNRLLVSIPDDLKRFRRLTLGKTVICGRKTLATFPGGRPLPGRRNLILSRTPGLVIEGAKVCPDLPAVFAAIAGAPDEAAVIGGESVYRALLDYCRTAHVTRTCGVFEADRFFPDLDALPNWHVADRSEILSYRGLRYQYLTYENTAPKAAQQENL